MKDFIADMKAIRERARKDIEDGAVTGNYQANPESGRRLIRLGGELR